MQEFKKTGRTLSERTSWPAWLDEDPRAGAESAPARNPPRISTAGRLPMDVFKYLDNQLERVTVPSRRQSASCRRRPRAGFAVLEERHLPSTVFVTTGDDNGDNVNPTPG